ncbi:hypothetical protein Vafri_7316 [Volvox africanus]|uniref:Uncharacterized protein n=1 Tax=Volvox africanus TaxID=51714 RepID=A0A8J4B053_9CHLO|nr:hypothetical protein Vafri_7316 [Volvox africanus]
MDCAALLAFLRNLSDATSLDGDEVHLYLQSFKDGFLRLLDFKGPSTESRRQVQQERKVTTGKHGVVALDPEPDVKQALLLSDELRLDEVLCVEYLISAFDERGIFGAEYGAGLYLEERQMTLRCLARLLALDAMLQHAHHYAGGQRTPIEQAIASFVSELLFEKDPSGKQILVSRLVTVLRDTSLEPRPDTPLPIVRDEAGNPVPRTVLLQKERREAARCLLYCCTRDPHVAPAVALELLELLTGLLSRLGGTGSGDLFLVEECQLVLLACCSVLVPHEGRNFQRPVLQELAQATRAKVVESAVPNPAVSQAGYSANLRMCWGLLAICSQGAPQDGLTAVRDALKGGAFTFLRQIFHHPHFKLDDQTHHHVVAAAVHHMVHTLLRTDSERMSNAFYAQLLQRSDAAIRPITQGGHPVLSYVPFPPESAEARSDHLGSLLGVLADCFEVFPDLYLANLADQEAGQRPIREFLDRAVNSNIMKSSPEVRVPFLQLLAALAGSERGVHLVLRQMDAMAQMPALEVHTLRKLFQTVLAYCVRFFENMPGLHRLQGSAMDGGMGSPLQEFIINPYEADILVAFFKLLKRVLEYGRPAEVIAFWSSTSAELAPMLNGFPLQEPLFLLMCFPVQNTIKAAVDEVLGALAAALPDMAPRLLDRLLQCTIVKPPSAVLPTVPRLDMVQQLNETESRREEYPETLALIRLLNALLGPLLVQQPGGGGSAGLPDGGADVTTFTTFVQQHVLGHLWSRGYRVARQKWEVAAAAFTHLQHVLELVTRGSLPPPQPANEAAANPKCPPGYLIMHDLLGGGPAYAALMHILFPGYASLTALQNQTDEVGPREAAVLAGLKVINAALRLDLAFVDHLSGTTLLNRYQPLHLKILSGGVRQLATLLQYVCYPDSADIQVEAISLTMAMATRMPNLVQVLADARPGPAGAQPVAGALPFITAAELGGILGAAETAAAMAATAVDLSDVLGSLRRGFAQAMSQGIEAPNPRNDLDAPPEQQQGPHGGPADPPDPRVAMVLRLLLQNSLPSLPVPSLTHLLLGYDMECGLGGRLDDSMLIPNREYSCLTILDRILYKDELSFAIYKPKLYSQCLCVLYNMATAPVGGTPMTDFLNPRNNMLIPNLRGLLNMEVPRLSGGLDGSELSASKVAAMLHCRALYMRITGLLLLRLSDEEPSRKLLSELLARPGESASTTAVESSGQGGAGEAVLAAANAAAAGGRGFLPGFSTLLETMRVVSALEFPAPQLSELSQEQRRMLQDLSTGEVGLEQILTIADQMNKAGVGITSDTGDNLLHIPALSVLLRQRLDAFAARAGGAVNGTVDVAADAVRAALRYALRYNAYMLVAGAQAAAVEAWQQLAQVVYTRQYEQLNIMLQGTAAEALYETLTASLEAVRGLLSRVDRPPERVSAPLCSAARVMLSKLQEQAMLHVSLGQAADPLGSVRVPARCQALLKLLVDLILLAHMRQAPAVRLQLYAAALQYLQLSRGSKLATSCTPTALSALLQGWGASAEAVAVLDQSEALIERANAAVISAQGVALVEALAADALSGNVPPLGQAVALHLLRALLTVDSASGGASGVVVAAAVYRQHIPQQLLAQIGALPATTLASGGKRARRAVHVLEAALALLAGLATAGPPAGRAASAQQLYSLNCVLALTRCAALDVVPDDPVSASLRAGLAFPSVSSDSVRYRLNALTAPVLRLLLTVLAALPDSPAVRADAAGFASGHNNLLFRLMEDAAGMETRTWAPGETELELADLVLGLLVRLVPSMPSLDPMLVDKFKAGAFKLAFQFCCLEERSASPIIQALRTWHRTGAATAVTPRVASGSVGPGAIVLHGAAPASATKVAGARSAACNLGARVQSLRCSLARLLRDMAQAAAATRPQAAAGATGTLAAMAAPSALPTGMLRAVGAPERRELDPLTGRPTLLLVRDMAQQACRDAAAALDELVELLALLRLPDAQLDEQTVTDRLVMYAPAGNAAVTAALAVGSAGGLAARRCLARHFWALAATSLDRQLSRALFVLEAALSTVAVHFLRFLPRPVLASSRLAGTGIIDKVSRGTTDMDTDELLDQATVNLDLAAATSAPTEADAAALGSSEELQYLMTQLQDTCLRSEELLSRLAEASANMAGTSGRQQLLGGGGASWGPHDLLPLAGQQPQKQPVEGIDLMVRALKMYCARS